MQTRGRYASSAMVLVCLAASAQAGPAAPSTASAASTQPATPASQPVPGVPIEAVQKVFQQALKAAEAAEAANIPAGPTQALAQYRRAQQLLQKFPALQVDPVVRDQIPRKIAELQAKAIAAQAARRAAASQSARAPRSSQSPQPNDAFGERRQVTGGVNPPNYGAGIGFPSPGAP